MTENCIYIIIIGTRNIRVSIFDGKTDNFDGECEYVKILPFPPYKKENNFLQLFCTEFTLLLPTIANICNF